MNYTANYNVSCPTYTVMELRHEGYYKCPECGGFCMKKVSFRYEGEIGQFLNPGVRYRCMDCCKHIEVKQVNDPELEHSEYFSISQGVSK